MNLDPFSLKHDEAYIVTTLREIQEINPSLFLLASPWSPPGWMKTYGTTAGWRTRDNYIGPYTHWLWDLSNESMLGVGEFIWSSIPATDQMLLAGTSLRIVARRFGTSTTSLHWHKQHISKILVKANDIAEIAKAD